MLRAPPSTTAHAGGFFVDSGAWTVSGGSLKVAAASLGKDAAAVFYVDDYLPVYYELAASVQTQKPTGGWKANAYLIFDYFSPTDFKFAGIDISINKLVMGYRDASGWHVVAQTPKQMTAATFYNLLLTVNGTTATLLVNGTKAFTHTYATRDGRRRPVRAQQGHGRHGVGQLPRRLRQRQGAGAPAAGHLRPQHRPDRLARPARAADRRAPGPTAAAGTPAPPAATGGFTPVSLDGTKRVASTSWLEVTTKVRAQSGAIAGLVFDGYATNDYKFAGLDLANQRVVIGHWDPRRGWVVDASVAKALTAGTLYDLSITLKGTSVSVSVNGGFAVSTGFNAGVVDGRFGLMARSGTATFTSLRVRTDDPVFLGTRRPRSRSHRSLSRRSSASPGCGSPRATAARRPPPSP